jgi:hypothetical protein
MLLVNICDSVIISFMNEKGVAHCLLKYIVVCVTLTRC